MPRGSRGNIQKGKLGKKEVRIEHVQERVAEDVGAEHLSHPRKISVVHRIAFINMVITLNIFSSQLSPDCFCRCLWAAPIIWALLICQRSSHGPEGMNGQLQRS